MKKILFLFMFAFIQQAEAEPILDCDEIRNDERMCLACNLYHEARGEEELGIAAVAMVTLNRVQSMQYPNSICAVVWQEYQFSWTNDGKPDQIYSPLRWKNILRISQLVLDNKLIMSKIDPNVLWYHRHDIETNWSKNLKVAAQIGDHTFFKE